MSEKDYAESLHLPKTSFQMKANLPNKEPNYIEKWKANKIYEKGLAKGKETFILHDGPPYANGNIHIGHAWNKILKDIITKYKTLRGYKAPYIPGWDTHGLPIELKVSEALGSKAKEMTTLEIRQKCKEYALKWVDIQREEFIRMGVIGKWEDPYLTLSPQFEAKQLEIFGDLYAKGYIFKGLKPIYWSPATETALAEAEIEYRDHTSPSVYVKMKANSDLLEKIGVQEEAEIVIWTTTPWTLPANMAISLNPDFDYGLYKTEKGLLILGKDLAEVAFQEMEIEEFTLIKEFKGSDLEMGSYQHPFLDRTGYIILGTHVTADAGTGCVHTAPGHGQEDYVVACRYNIPVISPINNKGVLTEEAGPLFAGMFYAKANKAIVDHLDKIGVLLKVKEITHSYPHDWRSKTPVIFRATEQWFVKVEGSDLREKALGALDAVEFIPSWGRNRIGSMLETRPDWCISRQRSWGVPIPVFYNEGTGEEIFNQDILQHVLTFVQKEGSDAWLIHTPEELIGKENIEKYGLEGIVLRKETNIMDVWFDSGSSHRAVLEIWKGLQWPADMYLEGSDQHRGWFQTSLLTSVGSKGLAPYRKVLTHGFVNDGKGEKMSKSKGNVVAPEKIVKQYGADILRLWSASLDYREDVKISDTIMKQMAEAYRRVRNTSRYILGNSYGFDPKKDVVPYQDLLEIDKWALHKLESLKRKVENSYEKYEFYNVFQEIHYFAGIDMSAFYLDIIKDRLYTEKEDSLARRSAQTVMIEILLTLTKMIAPILSFTAEEIWEHLPEELRDAESVLLTDWYTLKEEYLNDEIEQKWSNIQTLRKDVNKLLEKARQGEERIIGNSLDAKVQFYTEDKEWKEFLEKNSKTLEVSFIVSEVEIMAIQEENFVAGEECKEVLVKVLHADGEKCDRCWKYSTDLEEHSHICPRCSSVLK